MKISVIIITHCQYVHIKKCFLENPLYFTLLQQTYARNKWFRNTSIDKHTESIQLISIALLLIRNSRFLETESQKDESGRKISSSFFILLQNGIFGTSIKQGPMPFLSDSKYNDISTFKWGTSCTLTEEFDNLQLHTFWDSLTRSTSFKSFSFLLFGVWRRRTW